MAANTPTAQALEREHPGEERAFDAPAAVRRASCQRREDHDRREERGRARTQHQPDAVDAERRSARRTADPVVDLGELVRAPLRWSKPSVITAISASVDEREAERDLLGQQRRRLGHAASRDGPDERQQQPGGSARDNVMFTSQPQPPPGGRRTDECGADDHGRARRNGRSRSATRRSRPDSPTEQCGQPVHQRRRRRGCRTQTSERVRYWPGPHEHRLVERVAVQVAAGRRW